VDGIRADTAIDELPAGDDAVLRPGQLGNQCVDSVRLTFVAPGATFVDFTAHAPSVAAQASPLNARMCRSRRNFEATA
jgi:hypothetical protein